MRKISLYISLSVLAAAIVVPVWRSGETMSERHSNLVAQVPVNVGAWVSKDLPIADTPEMKRAVKEMLNYDEAVQREFRVGPKSFLLYAAYWRPGVFHPRLISLHVPDNCWVGNGMEMMKSDYNYVLKLDGWQPWHGQRRLFKASGKDVHVLYWHLVGDRLSGFAEGPESKAGGFIANLVSDFRQGAGEQFFIRLSSETPVEQWPQEELIQNILNSFRPVLEARK